MKIEINLKFLAQTGGGIHMLEEILFFSEISLVIISNKVERQTLVQRDLKIGTQ